MELEQIVKDINWETKMLRGASGQALESLEGAPLPLDKPRIQACLTVLELRVHMLRALVASCPS